MALYLRYAVRSDLGLVRTNNEDSVYAGPRLLAIADGMGGHAAGEVASKIVIGTMEPLDEDRRIDDLMGMLREAVVAANHGIAEAVQEKSELEGMGTTLTALRFVGNQVGLAHVGDSRAYLLRNDSLTQITHDDTYVQFLVDSGKISAEEAKDHPRKSVILKALLGSDVEPDVSIREARHNDRYLLCSDGLSDVVSTETILDTLRIPDPQDAADRLVELALRGGGPDNVTVIVADVINARLGDVIDDVPVVSGAFVDPGAVDGQADSAAERAAQITRSKAAENAPPPPAETPRRRRIRWRGLLISALAFLLVAGGLAGTYAWTQTQYFVGAEGKDSEVYVFRGVNTEFGPLKFFSVYQNTGFKITDLVPSVRDQVLSGITADSLGEARRIADNIEKNNLLPPCSSQRPSSTPGPTGANPTGSTPTGATPTGTAPTGATSSRRTESRSSGAQSAAPSAKRSTGTATTSTAPTGTGRSSSRPAAPSTESAGIPSATGTTTGSPGASGSPTASDAVPTPKRGETCR
ncbi:PP2C family protein-serine/threonine phosphatase [Jatrophihabitans fulvus]